MIRAILLAGLLSLGIRAGAAAEQAYPARPITMVVPAAPGGAVDVTARVLQARMAEVLGQALIVDNRPGAGGHIGNALVAKAAPDGYTILACSGSVLLSGVYPRLSYDPQADLTPIGMYATAGFLLLVPARSPFRSVDELLAHARAHPGALSFGSTGSGNSTHIAGEMLNLLAGVRTTHVPYRGSVPALTDLLGGRLDFLFDNKASAMPHVKSGALRVLGVTSAKRAPDLPDVPPIAQALPGFQLDGWIGLFAPARVDRAVVDKLSAALQKALADPATAARVSELVGEARYMPPAELRRYMAEDRDRLQRVVRAAGIVVD